MDPETGANIQPFRGADDAEQPSPDGVAGADGSVQEDGEATFFDTPDLALTRAGITLWHGPGDTAPWRLELSGSDGSSTVLPGSGPASDTVPEPLREALRLYVRDAQLAPLGRASAQRQVPREAARRLGDEARARSAGETKRLRRRSPAADVVKARLGEQLAEFEYWDVLTRWDAPDSVHKLRVATRRVRSALATFRPLLDRSQTDPLRDELKWIAGHLGEARDVEVAREQLTEAAAGEPPELIIGPVPQHVERELSAEFRVARERALEAMATDRYFALVDRLRAVAADPPWNRRAKKTAGKVLPTTVARDFKRLRKRVAAAEETTDPEKRATRLHDVRKAAKRVRYAAEAVIPTHGKDAERFAEAAERVQEVLGDHHDAVTLLPRVRELGMQAHLDGENAFSYGRLHALQETRIAELEAAYRDAWAAASRKKLRRWLR